VSPCAITFQLDSTSERTLLAVDHSINAVLEMVGAYFKSYTAHVIALWQNAHVTYVYECGLDSVGLGWITAVDC
jgi:hypothetical protein